VDEEGLIAGEVGGFVEDEGLAVEMGFDCDHGATS
jgi:hypothetical protein